MLGDEYSDEQVFVKGFLDKVIDLVGFETDPEFMGQLLTVLRLDGLRQSDNEDLQGLINRLGEEKLSLVKFYDEIKTGILENTPLLRIFDYICNQNLITDDELEQAQQAIKFSLHLNVLTECLTVVMLNNPSAAKALILHMFNARGVSNPGSTLSNFFSAFPYSAGVFERAKLVSVDPIIWNILCARDFQTMEPKEEEVDQFIAEHHLGGLNRSSLRSTTTNTEGLSVNILEALCSEAAGQKHDVSNAKAGLALIALVENIDHRCELVGDRSLFPGNEPKYDIFPGLPLDSAQPNTIETMDLSKEWCYLYVSWNMDFVLSNLPGLMVLHKLAGPSVLRSADGVFLKSRVFSLWITLNFYLALNQLPLNQLQALTGPVTSFENSDHILQQWSRVNETYANELLRQKLSWSSDMLDTTYQRTIGNYPRLAFLSKSISFFCSSGGIRITPEFSSDDSDDAEGTNNLLMN